MSVIDADIEMAEPAGPLSPYWKQVIEDAWARCNALELQRDRFERFALAYEAVITVANDDELSNDDYEAFYEEAAHNFQEARQALFDAGDIVFGESS